MLRAVLDGPLTAVARHRLVMMLQSHLSPRFAPQIARMPNCTYHRLHLRLLGSLCPKYCTYPMPSYSHPLSPCSAVVPQAADASYRLPSVTTTHFVGFHIQAPVRSMYPHLSPTRTRARPSRNCAPSSN